MNSEEGVSLAKMAVTVLLVVLVIGAVVAIVYQAYSWFTSGSDKLADQVNSIDSSSYSTYDDAQCAGTDVLTALKTYRDSDIAILIGNGQSTATYSDVTATTTGALKNPVINYCGVAANDTGKAAVTADKVGDVTAYSYKPELKDDGKWYLKQGVFYESAKGMATRNTNFSPTTDKSKKSTYVRQNAQFYSKLIYDDTTGEVCGIMFTIMQ